jgi:hypothetical protein
MAALHTGSTVIETRKSSDGIVLHPDAELAALAAPARGDSFVRLDTRPLQSSRSLEHSKTQIARLGERAQELFASCATFTGEVSRSIRHAMASARSALVGSVPS